MSEHTRRNKIRNEDIHGKVGVRGGQVEGSKLRWFGHVKRRSVDAQVRKCERLTIAGIRRGRYRMKRYWGW